jgi:hypothetical protein
MAKGKVQRATKRYSSHSQTSLASCWGMHGLTPYCLPDRVLQSTRMVDVDLASQMTSFNPKYCDCRGAVRGLQMAVASS